MNWIELTKQEWSNRVPCNSAGSWPMGTYGGWVDDLAAGENERVAKPAEKGAAVFPVILGYLSFGLIKNKGCLELTYW
jgi:hypothetical protein